MGTFAFDLWILHICAFIVTSGLIFEAKQTTGLKLSTTGINYSTNYNGEGTGNCFSFLEGEEG